MADKWRMRALCHGHPHPDIFFPDPKDVRGWQAAAAECAGCPVTAQCKADADGRREKHGVWGGWARSPVSGLARRIPPPAEHGTEGGWKAHKDRGEDPCDMCRHAASRAAAMRTKRRRAEQKVAS